MKIPSQSGRWTQRGGFTLVEILVSISVMILIMSILGEMFNGTAALITYHNKAMDADGQTRVLLDRMSIDFENMVKRTDVNYFLKSDNAETTKPQNYDLASTNPMTGASGGANDQIAFYSVVPGYFSSTTATQSALSLVGYRLNPTSYRMERYGRGLFWNGATPSGDQPVFLPLTFGSSGQWPNAISATATDTDYESMGPPVFRFEYYYLLKSGVLSTIPWDTAAGHTSINGLEDVAAIGVTLAAIDSKSRKTVSDATLSQLALNMKDFDATSMSTPGTLETQWRSVFQAGTVPIPATALPSLHIYRHFFYLNSH